MFENPAEELIVIVQPVDDSDDIVELAQDDDDWQPVEEVILLDSMHGDELELLAA